MAQTHLLVVDDDREIRGLLAVELAKMGYEVACAENGAAMRRALEQQTIDLVILDLNMPGEDGLTLCRQLRAASQVPIIMLTARGEPLDRIIGLEMGADDYLAKPFEPRELLARIRSVLRRTHALPHNLAPEQIRRARFAGWTFDVEHRQLIGPDGRVTILGGAEFRLLRLMIDHANRVLTREQLISLGALGQSEALDRAVDLQISRLRARFGSQGADIIRTVRNQGYVLASAVEVE
ncbi:response regulator [Solilutibacter silvestris]|uniref:Response regulator consisting of a CheY-like receiver domain and a winged-helix DNA-binding domain n=1 Tax=Solilutibacter silvestris TaxID=1645665 RepID=A0A2K1PXV4_9GAMM|nr:response regulator transcription factor [Lysobacter silvestris]PNS07620.1 Response regulator consisting of a CheY-like receiver domain and a winged-helix DNA-binding domain [Lysobacter silvestris]